MTKPSSRCRKIGLDNSIAGKIPLRQKKLSRKPCSLAKKLKKGIDFMKKPRYNWTVHEHNTKQEV
jgi:hypothetical protein